MVWDSRYRGGVGRRLPPVPDPIGHTALMGIASDSSEVRRLRYAFRKQGLRLRVQLPRSFEDYLADDPLWTITDLRGTEIRRDVSLDSLLFMAEDFGRP